MFFPEQSVHPFLENYTFILSVKHITQHSYHRFLVPPSCGTAAMWVVPARAGCSPRSFLFASSGWHPGERAAVTAAYAPHPGRRACWCPTLQKTTEHPSFPARNRKIPFEVTAFFFHLLFLCTALHSAHKSWITLISLMEFNVVLYEAITEIKLS